MRRVLIQCMGRPIEFDKIPGTLRWNDVPDTISARPTTNGRPIVEIANERSLHIILKSINHRSDISPYLEHICSQPSDLHVNSFGKATDSCMAMFSLSSSE